MSSRRAGYQSLGEAGDSLLDRSAAVGDVEAPPPPPPPPSSGVPAASPVGLEPPTALEAPAQPSPSLPQPPSQPPAAAARFPIRILDTTGREHTIDAGSTQATVASVKEKVAEATGVQPILQRLIFCGKMLTDSQTLQAAGVVSPNVVVHLFARPSPPAGSAGVGGAAGAAGGVEGAAGGNGAGGPNAAVFAGGWVPGFGDPELIRSTHSVRLLSSCLVAVCTMQLLLLFLRLIAQWQGLDGAGQPAGAGDDDADGGQPGGPANLEDSNAILFLEVLMNTLGLYVGLAGVRSANTLSLQTAKTYMFGLVAVGTLWLSLRVIWAINSVNLGYDADLGPQPGSGGDSSNNGTESGGGDNGGGGGAVPPMDRNELIYMVTLSCMIYVCVWSVCFLRASQFYVLLRRANGEAA